MKLAVSGLDAVRILRSLRQRGVDIGYLPRTSLCAPDPAPYQRLRVNHLDLEALCLEQPPSSDHRIEVAVPTRGDIMRASFARCVLLRPQNMPQHSFIEIGGGIQIPCPELLFIQMGAHMLPAIHLAFGMELCGSFTRDAMDPLGSPACFGVTPVTSATRIRAYLARCKDVTGIARARKLEPFLCDNAWSPMEAVVASLLCLPAEDCGYGLAPLLLNERVAGTGAMAGERASRVPDILFAGSHIGFNYDGSGHLDLDSVVDAATHAALTSEPEQASSSIELERAVNGVREKYVDDRRRDRELWAHGMQVMPIVAEDLVQVGGLDHMIAWALDRMQAEGPNAVGQRDVDLCRMTLRQPAITRMRQQLIWSMLPGRRGHAARARIARRYTPRRFVLRK